MNKSKQKTDNDWHSFVQAPVKTHSFDFTRPPHSERIFAAGIDPAGLNLRNEASEERDEPNDKEAQVEKQGGGGRMEGVHGVPVRLHSCWNGSHRGLAVI